MRLAPSPVDPRLIVALALGAAGLYLFFLCPNAYWGDSAALSASLDAAPTPFTRSYWLFKRPALFGVAMGLSPALAANATSALFGAAAVATLGAAAQRLGGGRAAAVVAAGTLAVAHTWWSVAEVAEVYTLFGLLLSGLLVLAPSQSRRGVVALGLLAGLSVNHHRMILPAVVASLGFSFFRAPEQRRWLAASFALGLTPFVLLCIAHPPRSLPPMDGTTPGSLWLQRLLLGGHGSAAQLLGARGGWRGAASRQLRFLALNFPGPALLLALPGARWLLRRDRAFAALLALLSVAGLGMAMSMRWAGDGEVYLLSVYPLLALLAGLGAGALWRRRRSLAAGTSALAILGPPILYATLQGSPAGELLLPRTPEEVRTEFFWPGRRGWDAGPGWWDGHSADLDRGAVVISRWREGTILRYRQRCEGFRPDLRTVVGAQRSLVLDEPDRPAFVTWTPASRDIPVDVARLDLLLQGEEPGLRRVVLRGW